jgi:hypothetical protein
VQRDLGNTLVFLLAENTTFKEGEVISVHISGDLTMRGSPIDDGASFSFRVSGGSVASGELRVLSTVPSPGATFVAGRPKISANFNRAVTSEGLASSIVVRGAQSGTHAGGEPIEIRTKGPSSVLEVRRTLAAGETLRPGESVDVTLSAAITEAVAGTTGGPQNLRPHHLNFQVAPGSVQGGWMEAQSLGSTAASPVALLAADFIRPAEGAAFPDGVEFVVVGKSSVTLFFQSGGRRWSQNESQLTVESETDTFEIVAAAVYDVEPGGVPEVVLLLSGTEGSRIQALEVSASGFFRALGDPVDLPATPVHTMTVADLDANGRPEILIPHPSRTFTPAPGQSAQTTGLWTLLEFLDGVPELDPENPADIQNLQPDPKFTPVADALRGLGGLTPATRVEAADLNGDGKLDLIVEEADELFLHRNLGTSTTRFAFRSVGTLSGRSGATLQPLAWVVADVDVDGDQDVLAWDDAGALLHRNRQRSEDSLREGDEAAIFFGLLEEDLPPEALPGFPHLSGPATALALELDGRELTLGGILARELDLVILGGDGSLTVLPAGADELFFPGDSRAPVGFAVADLDGDTGLDFVFTLPDGETHLFLAEQVTEPISAEPSSFEFVTESLDSASGMIEVAVRGDFKEQWSGFGIALDFDESHLDYRGFEPSSLLERKGTFTLCPDASFNGCEGNAAVSFTYDPQPGSSGSDSLSLGTFLFAKRPVSQPVMTTIEFESFVGPDDVTFDNTVHVIDGAVTLDEAAFTGDPVVIELQPTALVATCRVLSREENSLFGEVTWSSPGGLLLTNFAVTVQGQAEVGVVGASLYSFETTRAGVISIVVSARDAMKREVTAECEVIGVHQPLGVTCAETGASTVRVQWDEHPHAVDRFVIYRNGARLEQTAAGNASEFVDTPPDTTIAINYEVAASLRGVEGPRGSCTLESTDTGGQTARPTNVAARLLPRGRASDPNVLRFRWTNGEGYDRTDGIIVRLTRGGVEVFNESLDGTAVEYIYAGENFGVGDNPAQGAQPHDAYTFSVAGRTQRGLSDTVSPPTFVVPVPALPIFFSCAVDSEGDVQLEWDPVWPGYSVLELVTLQCVDGAAEEPLTCDNEIDRQSLDLSGFITSATETLGPGTYEFRLEASHLVGSTLERTCRVPLESSVFVDQVVEAGIGNEVEIPVYANVVTSVTGFQFELEYPSFVEIPANGIRVDHAGAQTTLSITAGSGADMNRAVVSVENIATDLDADGDGKSEGKILLGTIIGTIPEDFTLLERNDGEYDLRFAQASLNFGSGQGDVATDDGNLQLFGRYVTIEQAIVQAGSTDEIRLLVKTTFRAPPSVPDYHVNAYQLDFTWDAALLELEPTTDDDLRAVLDFDPERPRIGGQFFYSETPTPVDEADQTDENADFVEPVRLGVGWLGLLPNPLNPAFVEPGVGVNLFVLKFRSKVKAGEAATFATVNFLSDTTKLTVPFEQERASVPDLEGWFGGGVQIESEGLPFVVRSVLPATGSLLGGNEVTIRGVGFGENNNDIEIRLMSPEDESEGLDLVVPPADIISVSHGEIRFNVPDSGIGEPPRQAAFATSTPVDVLVTVGSRTATLVRGYTYDYPRVDEVSITSGRASGGDVMILRGGGLSGLSTVTFTVRGALPRTAFITGAAEDGKSLRLFTPDLRGFENREATIEVEVSDGQEKVARVLVEEKFEILPDGSGDPGGATLILTSIEPLTGSMCGGEQLVITGTGFLSLSVMFGDVPAERVDVSVDGKTAIVRTPAVPEGTEAVAVSVLNGVAAPVFSAQSFVFEHADPEFIRGDVDENGSLGINDATLLSDILFKGATDVPENSDACDANDDGVINVSDVRKILDHLFGGLPFLPQPSPDPGLDPTPDELHTCG